MSQRSQQRLQVPRCRGGHRTREPAALGDKQQAVRMLAEPPRGCGRPRLEAARRSHPRRAGSGAASPPTHSRRRSASMNGQRWTPATYVLCFRLGRPEFMRRIEADQQHLGFSNPGADHDQQRSRVASNADRNLFVGRPRSRSTPPPGWSPQSLSLRPPPSAACTRRPRPDGGHTHAAERWPRPANRGLSSRGSPNR